MYLEPVRSVFRRASLGNGPRESGTDREAIAMNIPLELLSYRRELWPRRDLNKREIHLELLRQ